MGRMWTLGLLAAALLGAGGAAPARAQDGGPDLRDLRPFIMMMVDTSGSMELQIDCTCSTLSCNECMPVCDPGSNDPMDLRPPNEKKSRWMVTLEALTGEFVDYQCTPLDRTALNGSTYDIGYYRKYGQPWDCNTTDGAGDGCKAYPPGGGPSGANINQTPSGILDQYGERARFGLMTFDGWDTYLGNPPLVDFNEYDRTRAYGQDGLWSYGSFYGSNQTQEYLRPFEGNESDSVAGSAAMRIPGHFKYPNCPTTYQMDTGARGPNATEGGLLTIDSCPGGGPCSMLGLANRIQEVLLDTRPWGGTPIAAMLEDLYFHLENENTDDYASCRGTFGVLITDGKPDDDYRKFGCDCFQDVDAQAPGYCGSGGGNDPLSLFCPYMKPADIARDLVMGRPGRPAQLAELHVIGLALDDDARAILDEVALEGGTDMVQDVSDQALLQQSLAGIVDKTFSAVSRTVPLFVNARFPESLATRQYEITTGFTVAEADGDPWTGFIERKRYECVGPDLTAQDLEAPSAPTSDRFETRLNVQNNRTMWTVVPALPPLIPGVIENHHATATCGLDGTQCRPTTFVNNGNMFIAPGSLTALDLQTGVSPTRDEVIEWMIGAPGSPRDGKRLGDIFHSSPQVVGAPLNDRGDSSYNLFRQQVGVRNRALTMFVNSNDGLIHAFAVEPVFDNLGGAIYKPGDEIWSFVPPVLLPRLKAQLNTHQVLLDGTPTIKDVYMDRATGIGTDVQSTTYRTVLVTGMRGGGNSYIALDVTDPLKPEFLWQFTDPDLGMTYAQPTLVQATYLYDTGAGYQKRSRGVAILPGGAGREADYSGDEPGCDPISQTATSYQQQNGMGAFETLTGVGELTTIEHRTNVRCWEAEGRSLYFVDVDTGKLIKKLHRDPGGMLMFPAPITGTPVAFSNEVGVEASRAFVTDANGVIWRIDLSDTEQQMEKRGADGLDFHDGWTARPFHDIFHDRGPNDGELSIPAPVLTTDEFDNLVLVVGTGDTDNFAKITAENRVVSVTEVLKPNLGGDSPENYQAALNWQLMVQPEHPGLAVSELITGALTLYEGTVYFSSFISVPGADPCDFGKGRMWAVNVNTRGAPNRQTPPLTYSPLLVDVYAGQLIAEDDKLINIDQNAAKDDLLLQSPTVNEGVSCTVITPSLVSLDFDYDSQYNVTAESGIAGYASITDDLSQEAPPTMMLVAPAAQGGMGGIAMQLGGAATAKVESAVAKPIPRTRVMGLAGGAD